MDFLDRTKLLVGEENINKLSNSKVIIFGVGGVGGYVLEMLARSGVGSIDIVDFDVVDTTNLNRQIISTIKNIGKIKVDVAKERVLSINPNLKINAINNRVSEENIDEFFKNDYDIAVDCIDSVKDKMALIEYCYKNNIKIISSMGAGNRIDIPDYIITDIHKTSYDKLAKTIRKQCCERGIKKLTVCYTKQQPIRNEKPVGSISYHPAMCGIKIASYVTTELIKN